MRMLKCRCSGLFLMPGTALVLAFALAFLPVKSAQAAPAPAAAFDAPAQVLLTPQNARVQVEAKAAVSRQNGQPVLELLLPQEAQEPALELLPPHTGQLRSWSAEITPLQNASGSVARQRAALVEERDRLQGSLRAVQARLALWSTPPATATPEQLEQRDARMRTVIPAAALEQARLERGIEEITQKLATLPDTARRATRITLLLNGDVKEGATLTVRYAYTLPNCGWKPAYTINAEAEAIQVSLQADIWQYSGMDWAGARIALTTYESWQRVPSPVFPWLIRKQFNESVLKMERMAAPMSAAPSMLKQDSAPVAFESDVLSGWVLPDAATLPEGKTRLPILQEVWQDKLQRIARPARNDNRVWIMAKHVFSGTPLPSGEAAFYLEGSAVGQGMFEPGNGEVSLFFGSDPLMEVKTEPDTRMSGKSGIINKRQTWKWGWTYTVFNHRAQAVTVRLEEPAPQATDESITVTLDDAPPAQQGEDHTLFWDVSVPARGTAQVRHAVSISAPEGMNIQPGR